MKRSERANLTIENNKHHFTTQLNTNVHILHCLIRVDTTCTGTMYHYTNVTFVCACLVMGGHWKSTLPHSRNDVHASQTFVSA